MNNNVIERNEIDKLFTLIKTYKTLVIILTIMGTILSIIYASVVHKPIYSALVLIQVGKENRSLIEPIKPLELKLINKYNVNATNKALPRVYKIKIRDKKNGIIRLQAKGYDKEELSAFLEEKVSEIVTEHNTQLDNFIKTKNEKIDLSNDMLQKVDDEIREIKLSHKSHDKALSTLDNNQQALINMNLLQMIRGDGILERAYNRRDVYIREINTAKRQILKKYTYETQMIDNVKVEDKPVTLSKFMIMVLGIVGFFILSTLLALFISFLPEKKKKANGIS
ncbi:MAG: Unknown protein [uncultured Sulfurovum sp.]|uniref:Polysaccharide chain length determinant N-terminal domain-containing protein n=1 Tax=uncultured Sulfurovum sp. TaxID=269237 RepID=A0A6S6T7J7_9BACT|nr:MAG: Unknown protein [uncultured Sulfurovum sp.]